MAKRKVVRYATKDRMSRVNPDSLKVYSRYLSSNISSNPDVKETTYKVYQSNFNMFLCYLLEHWDNVYVLDEELLEADSLIDDTFIDVIEGYMTFCREELGNNKKAINNKVAAISSFYIWCVDRRILRHHPFPTLKRMKGAGDEKIIREDFLTLDQVNTIYTELDKVFEEGYEGPYDPIDTVLWAVAYYSGARVGALKRLTFESIVYNKELEEGYFENIREKLGKIVNLILDKRAYDILQKFKVWREEKGIDTDFIFPSFHEGEWGAMGVQSIALRVRKIGEIVGLKEFRPHSIRKTRGNIVGGQDPELAKLILNHEDVSTTLKFYVEQKSATSLFDKIKLADKGQLKQKNDNN